MLVGAALLVVTTTGIGGELIILVFGGGFLLAYAFTRLYGLLIPGAILTGLGGGILASTAGVPGDWPALGLGLGFLAIAAVDRLMAPARGGWWWPLIPGGIITLASLSRLPGMEDAGRFVAPVVLIVIGLLLLLRRGRPPSSPKGGEHRREPDREVGDGPTQPPPHGDAAAQR